MADPTGKSGAKDVPWTAANTRELKSLHGQSLSLNEIARRMDRPPSTIHGRAKRLGLTFDRSQVETANIARSVDAKARRQELASRLYARGHKVLDRLDGDTFQAKMKGEYGKEKIRALPFVPSDDERQMAAAAGQYLAAAVKLEAIDSDSGVADAVSMLGKLARAIGLSDDVDDTTDNDPT